VFKKKEKKRIGNRTKRRHDEAESDGDKGGCEGTEMKVTEQP
jgi:hypothetical protein